MCRGLRNDSLSVGDLHRMETWCLQRPPYLLLWECGFSPLYMLSSTHGWVIEGLGPKHLQVRLVADLSVSLWPFNEKAASLPIQFRNSLLSAYWKIHIHQTSHSPMKLKESTL